MRIGNIAKQVGCHVETIRYYEKQGLIPPALREANGYGKYSDHHLGLLRLIRHAKGLGFSQDQIRSLSHMASNQNKACEEVYRLTVSQLAIIDEKIALLKKMKKDLQTLSRGCAKNKKDDCPALSSLIMG